MFTKKKNKRASTKKEASGFTIMLIPDSSDAPKTNEISYNSLVRLVAGAIAIAIIMLGLFVSVIVHNFSLKKSLVQSQLSIRELESVNEKLGLTIASLNEQLQSNQEVFDKIQASINEQREELNDAQVSAAIPDGIPIKGTNAVVVNDPNEEVEGARSEGIVFSTTAGAIVVASGSGIIKNISDDTFYTKKITIDHENGYLSVYRIPGVPSIEVGARVNKNDALYVLTEDGIMAFEIIKDGQIVNPQIVLAN